MSTGTFTDNLTAKIESIQANTLYAFRSGEHIFPVYILDSHAAWRRGSEFEGEAKYAHEAGSTSYWCLGVTLTNGLNIVEESQAYDVLESVTLDEVTNLKIGQPFWKPNVVEVLVLPEFIKGPYHEYMARERAHQQALEEEKRRELDKFQARQAESKALVRYFEARGIEIRPEVGYVDPSLTNYRISERDLKRVVKILDLEEGSHN